MLFKRASKIEYDFEDKFDVVLIGAAFLLVVFGLMAIYSSTANNPAATGNFQKQLYSAILSLVVFGVVYFLPSRFFEFLAIPSYILGIMLLLVVLVAGKKVYGSRSWLEFGPIGFQPSEFAKVATIFFLSSFLSKEKVDINSFKDVALALLIGFIPVGLILLEPDTGTAFVFMAIILLMLFWKGISMFGLFIVISPLVVILSSIFGNIAFAASLVLVLVLLFYFKKNFFFSASIFVINLAAGFFFESIYHALSPHQQRRIETFMDPNADPLGAGYNVIQARVAIGSGGLLGKGYMQGNQTQLRFIPKQWTDFIYCVIGEEFGFIGSIIILILFLVIFIRLLKISYFAKAKDEFLSLLVIGILALMFFHFLINIGMTIGVMPVVGLPLPFLSYGGSSLLVNIFLIAVAANIYKNRKQFA